MKNRRDTGVFLRIQQRSNSNLKSRLARRARNPPIAIFHRGFSAVSQRRTGLRGITAVRVRRSFPRQRGIFFSYRRIDAGRRTDAGYERRGPDATILLRR